MIQVFLANIRLFKFIVRSAIVVAALLGYTDHAEPTMHFLLLCTVEEVLMWMAKLASMRPRRNRR